ncbi:hypothetical protein [Amycolatopsis sp. cmx-11-51]|uniref:hypothetical protein n=1 Tax=unclassified Amycolatopsis TaxID=2618356 RepID=UPI0039E3AE17
MVWYFAARGVCQRTSKLTHIDHSFGNVTGCALGGAVAATIKFYDAASSAGASGS